MEKYVKEYRHAVLVITYTFEEKAIKELEYTNKHEINIYNAIRGGGLEIFSRVNFDSLFA